MNHGSSIQRTPLWKMWIIVLIVRVLRKSKAEEVGCTVLLNQTVRVERET